MDIRFLGLIVLMLVLFFWTMQRAYAKFKKARILKLLQNALQTAINDRTDEYLETTILWFYDYRSDVIFAVGVSDPGISPSSVRVDDDIVYICKTEKGIIKEWAHEFR